MQPDADQTSGHLTSGQTVGQASEGEACSCQCLIAGLKCNTKTTLQSPLFMETVESYGTLRIPQISQLQLAG